MERRDFEELARNELGTTFTVRMEKFTKPQTIVGGIALLRGGNACASAENLKLNLQGGCVLFTADLLRATVAMQGGIVFDEIPADNQIYPLFALVARPV